MLSANCANWRELFLSYTAPHSFWLLEAGAKIGRRKSRNRTRRRNRLPCLCYPRIARIGANYSFLTPRRIPSGCSRQVLIRVSWRNSRIMVQRSEEALPAREPVVLAVEGQGYGGRLPHNALPLHRPEITGVQAIVAIVPHHEVMRSEEHT